MDVNRAVATAVKTGKVFFGANEAVKNAKNGRARLIIVAANCPQKTLEEIEYYSRISKVPVVIYKGNSIDLGAVCGKPFMVSALTVREPGDSEILRVAEAANA